MKNAALFDEYAKDILESEAFAKCKDIYSHGSISVYTHSIAVAKLAFSMIEDSKTIDKQCVVRAALLHDLYLYEWHVPGMRYLRHGWAHPAIAAKNARDLFGVSDHEGSCIKTHMWPWTLFKPPKSREAWIISLADKIVSIRETLWNRGKRHPLQDPLKGDAHVTYFC
jgi:uncharacterized protein